MKSYCNFWRCVPLFLATVCIFPLMVEAQNMNTGPLPVPILPNINTNNIITITNSPYNAVGDGVTTNTTAIQNAINAANTGGNVGGLFGGTVRIPGPGTYLTGPLTFKNNVNIQVDSGATLKMLPMSVWTNLPAQNQAYGNLLYATGVTNLEISGSGTIDGQGAAWWTSPSSVFNNRSYMIFFNGNCKRVLIQGVTFQNPPKMHIVFKGVDSNITIQGITINTTAANAANTDGIDLVGTTCLIQNCTINTGDDNIALGSSSASAISADILVTNCTFGKGHGVSIGSNTAGSVSNLTVINCTFSGTDYGIRMKSNDSTGSAGNGGITQNLSYLNLGMTNIVDGAVVIYSYYDSSAGGQFGTPTGVSPVFASTQPIDVTTVPIWRNITISNVNATVTGGGVAGIIWARMEVPATNIVFSHVNISAPKPFEVYSASGIQFNDCKITPPAGSPTFQLYNAQVIISNSVPTNILLTFDGLTTNGFGNTLAFYNAQASLKNTNAFDDGPLTIGAGTFIVSNNLTLFPATVLNFVLGTNAATVAVKGNLALGGTNNIKAGPGFTNGTYTLMTYTGTLSGNKPVLAATPAGFSYTVDTNTAGQVNLVVTPPPPGIPTNLTALGTNLLITLKWSAPSNAASYNLKRSTTNGGTYSVIANVGVTNYSDPAVNPGTTYYYVVSATNSVGESGNSLQASAIPLPSLVSTNLDLQASGNQLQLSWPQDHLGWRLQIQTNDLSSGLGANWVDWPGSTNVIQTNIVIDPANGPVFLRLIYP